MHCVLYSMNLTTKNMAKVLESVAEVDYFRNMPRRLVAKHLDRLSDWDQLEVKQNQNGELLYAWAWWKINKPALNDLHKMTPPRRFNRGSNIVTVFAVIDNYTPIKMLRAMKRALRIEKARTHSYFSRRLGKWVTKRVDRSGTTRKYR